MQEIKINFKIIKKQEAKDKETKEKRTNLLKPRMVALVWSLEVYQDKKQQEI